VTASADLVYAYIGKAARKILEASMGQQNYEFQSEFAQRFIAQGRDEGRAQGRRATLLAVIEARGLTLTDTERQRIESCTDAETLDRWARAAAVASNSQSLFEEA